MTNAITLRRFSKKILKKIDWNKTAVNTLLEEGIMNDEGTNQVYGIANTTASISYFLFYFFYYLGLLSSKFPNHNFLYNVSMSMPLITCNK